MEDSRRTYSVLVVAAAAKFHMSLREMLPEDRYDPVCAAGSVSEARRALLERPFDIVVISTPLPDEFGTKLALHIIDKSSAGVLLLVKAEHYPDLAARLAPHAAGDSGGRQITGCIQRIYRRALTQDHYTAVHPLSRSALERRDAYGGQPPDVQRAGGRCRGQVPYVPA